MKYPTASVPINPNDELILIDSIHDISDEMAAEMSDGRGDDDGEQN